jgi:dipeptidase D
VYEQLFSQPPKVAAIHAGLECGIIGERVGGMDMVSLGPTIRGAHSPDERVYVASVERTWRYLVALLAALSRG